MNGFRYKITNLSFILAVLIVIRHSLGIGTYNLPEWLYYGELFVQQATDLVVPVFFAISGFLFFNKLTGLRDWYEKIKRRFKSLFVPYVIWCLIGYLFVLAIVNIPQIANKTNFELPQFEIWGFLYDTFWDTKYNITWFIRDLMIYMLFFSPVFVVVSNKKMWQYGGVISLLLLGYYLNDTTILYSVPFFFGALMSVAFNKRVQQRFSFFLVCLSGFLLLITIVFSTVLNLPQGAIMIGLRLIQIPLVWIFADGLAMKTKTKWWLNLSFFIYVAHHMLLESVEKCFLVALGNTTFGASIDLIFAPIITVLILVCLAKILIRFAPNVWGILNGGR